MQTIGLKFSLILALAASACSTAQPSRPTDTTTQQKQPSVAAPEPALTIEDLLRWPLEGRSGADRVISALHRAFDMKPGSAAQYYGDGPIRLADKNVLTFADTLERSPQIDIGVAQEPCVDPKWAANVMRATLDPAIQDAHGVDRGQTYKTVSNGVITRINTTPVTYRCVTAIRVFPEPGKRP